VSRRAWLGVLGALLVCALALRVVFFVGLMGWDDIEYREASVRLLAGDLVPHSLFGLRWGVTLPLAAVLALGGTGERAIAVVPLAYSLVGIVLAFAVGRRLGGVRAGLIAAGVLVVLPLDVLAASDLHADLAASVFLALAAYLALRAESSTARAPVWLALAGASVALATLTKESSVAFALVLAIWAIRRRWPGSAVVAVVLGFAAVVLADTGWLRAVTGTWLYRFSPAMTAPHAAHMRMLPPSHGWMLDYVAMLLDPRDGHFGELAGVFYIVLVGTLVALAARAPAVPDVLVWWATLLVALSVAPLDASLTRPLFMHFPRTLHPLLVPFAVTVGLGAAAWRGAPVAPRLVAGAFAIVCAAGLWATHFDARQWAAVARQAAPVIERTAPDAPVVTDEVSAALLRSLLPDHRAPIASVTASASDATLLLRDPLFVASALQHGRPVAPAVLAPPPAAERVAVFERGRRPRVRAWLTGGDRSPADAATMWRVRGGAAVAAAGQATR
jgi:4-amino-4-deoxy-L-arabinose transferase-like glycosyltransferase